MSRLIKLQLPRESGMTLRAARVDEIDYEFLRKWKWLAIDGRFPIADSQDSIHRSILMNRAVAERMMGKKIPSSLCVHVINGDHRDMRRCNLFISKCHARRDALKELHG